MHGEMNPVKRADLFFNKTEARLIPRHKLLNGPPYLCMDHHLDVVETYLADFHKESADRRNFVLFLKFEHLDKFVLRDGSAFDEEIADLPRRR